MKSSVAIESTVLSVDLWHNFWPNIFRIADGTSLNLLENFSQLKDTLTVDFLCNHKRLFVFFSLDQHFGEMTQLKF